MYLIKMVSFDSLENQISKAIRVDNVGIINGDEQDAQKWIDDHKSTTTYLGWDGVRYPYYEKEFIDDLRHSNHSATDTKEEEHKTCRELSQTEEGREYLYTNRCRICQRLNRCIHL